MANNKVALITGVTGQDGAYLAEFLLDKGYEVHGIKRRSSSFNTDRIDHLYQDPHESDRKFVLHYGDLSDSMSLVRIIQKILPDEIYNLGAQSHVAVSFETPEYTADTVGLGALRILEAIRISGLEKKLAIIKHLLQSYMEKYKKSHKKKLRLFIRVPLMQQLSCMLIGLLLTIVKLTACMRVMVFCLIMSPLYVAKPLLLVKLRVH